ncbi:MAG: 7TM diverse intracellular signaling domain-containing protein [Pedobacter sp.]|nr:7TM diverse intracellular signaling domain-containing protein [Pedobacter sp.]
MPLHRSPINLLLSLWLLAMFVTGAANAGSVRVEQGEIRQNLGRHLEYYFDRSGTMTLADIRQLPDSAFQPSHYDIPNFSFTSAHVWLRLKVNWQAPDRSSYMIWQQYPLTDHFTFYRPDDRGAYEASLTGDQYPFRQREFPVRAFGFELQAHPGQTDTYYFELHGAGTINVDLQLTSINQALADTETRHLLLGLYYGGLVALLLFNLVLFFTLRESIYFYYTLYGVGLGLAFFDVNGLAFRYLWPDTIWMNTSFLVFVFLSMYAQAQFTRKFLNLRHEWRKLDWLFLFFMACNLLALLAVFFIPDHFLYPASQRLAAVIAILSLLAGTGLWIRGYKPARYFTLASGFYVVGMLVYVMQNFGVLPTSVLSNYSVQIGSSFELILFSFALADRINHMKDEKSALEAAARRQLQEHNQTLESKVHERTQDLLKSLRAVNEKHEALMAAQQQLVQSEKMSSLGGLVAGVAHEINNPANFTRLAAENLERDILRLQDFLHSLTDENSDPELIKDLDKRFGRLEQQLSLIHDGTRRLSLIVSDLRSFSRLDESEAQIARPDDGLAATLNLVRAQYGDSINISLQQDDAQTAGFCYPAALNQVFMNLAVNACQAITERARQEGRQIPPLGTLRVHTRCGEATQDFWQAEFHDDGHGMDDKTQQRIFEPFFTTKDVGSGTGLGLSVSYGIVRKHGGEILVESVPGQGSCFSVRLPLKQQAIASLDMAAEPKDITHPGEKHGTV